MSSASYGATSSAASLRMVDDLVGDQNHAQVLGLGLGLGAATVGALVDAGGGRLRLLEQRARLGRPPRPDERLHRRSPSATRAAAATHSARWRRRRPRPHPRAAGRLRLSITLSDPAPDPREVSASDIGVAGLRYAFGLRSSSSDRRTGSRYSPTPSPRRPGTARPRLPRGPGRASSASSRARRTTSSASATRGLCLLLSVHRRLAPPLAPRLPSARPRIGPLALEKTKSRNIMRRPGKSTSSAH